MSMPSSSADLLKELRIDRSAPPPPTSRRGLWITLAVEVQTAEVVAIGGSGGGPTTVLDATGYVVARRMATVSAKITGKVRDVRIEEGMHVDAGQIMATLDPIDADAERALANSQVSMAKTQIDSMQAQVREADANVRRLDGLVKQQLVSKAQYD